MGSTERFRNGIYMGTDYSYIWNDQKGELLFGIVGSFSGRNDHKQPKDLSDTYYFGKAAELRWSNFKLTEYIDKLNEGGEISFAVSGYTIHVSNLTLSISQKGQKEVWNADDIQGIDLQKGQITLTLNSKEEHNWLGKLFGKGKVKIPYAEMPNAKLFFHLTHKIYGK